MKFRNLSSAFLVLCLATSLAAQGRPGGTHSGGGGVAPNSPDLNGNLSTGISGPGAPTPIFLSGKVKVDDGMPLTDFVLIQTVCDGNVHNEGYTNSKGEFNIELGTNTSGMLPSAEDSNPLRAGSVNQAAPGISRRYLQGCDLRADLPGFTSQAIPLAEKINDIGSVDVGLIILHRMQEVTGLTMSATTLLAPKKARKEYEKGREDEKKGKWEAAEAAFTKAVQSYPKYAVAWVELGRAELQKNDVASAKVSFRQAIAADPTFIVPYQELSELALKSKQWKDLADSTEQVVRLNGLSFPQYWYFNALANYFLKTFDHAEKSAARGLSVDTQHRIPKLEYLMGIILAQKHDYSGAAAHLRIYVRLLPNAADIAMAQKQIAELDQLSRGTQSNSAEQRRR